MKQDEVFCTDSSIFYRSPSDSFHYMEGGWQEDSGKLMVKWITTEIALYT